MSLQTRVPQAARTAPHRCQPDPESAMLSAPIRSGAVIGSRMARTSHDKKRSALTAAILRGQAATDGPAQITARAVDLLLSGSGPSLTRVPSLVPITSDDEAGSNASDSTPVGAWVLCGTRKTSPSCCPEATSHSCACPFVLAVASVRPS